MMGLEFNAISKAYGKMLKKQFNKSNPEIDPFELLSESDRKELSEAPDIKFLSEGLDDTLGRWMNFYKSFNLVYPEVEPYFDKIENLYGQLIETISTYYGQLVIEMDKKDLDVAINERQNLIEEYMKLN
jgi:hypothetical protein